MGVLVKRGSARIPLMPAPNPELSASSFVMAPYSNRIADGRFVFRGQVHQLRNGENHAIHGDVRKRPWVIRSPSPERIILDFSSADHEAVNWPWPFTATLTYQLSGPRLETTLRLVNAGAEPMPAGCGFHPYFLRSPSRPGEPVLVQFSVGAIYPDGYGNRIPSGPPLPPTAAQDFSAPRPLDPEAFHDFCTRGYDGAGSITWPESGIRLRFHASPALGHLVFFNPPKPWFAMEPVSNANDGFNLYARGEEGSGVRVLEPGEALEVGFGMEVEEV